MSGVRAPRFAGITGGVGTSTLAAALHGVDTGRYAGGPVDVLVCGPGSLGTAARLGAPVLVVVAERPPRLDRLAAGFGAVVTVPEIAAWRALDAPDVGGLLGVVPQRLPARMRPYADALLEITAALLRSGVLERPAHPVRPSVTPAAMERPAEIGRRRTAAVPAPVARLRVVPVPVVIGGSAVPVPGIAGPVVAHPDRPAPVATTTGAAANPTAARAAVARIAAASVTPAPAASTTAVARPLWRGLQAVQRTPVPVGGRVRSDAPGPTELDDDAVESQAVDPLRAG